LRGALGHGLFGLCVKIVSEGEGVARGARPWPIWSMRKSVSEV